MQQSWHSKLSQTIPKPRIKTPTYGNHANEQISPGPGVLGVLSLPGLYYILLVVRPPNVHCSVILYVKRSATREMF